MYTHTRAPTLQNSGDANSGSPIDDFKMIAGWIIDHRYLHTRALMDFVTKTRNEYRAQAYFHTM